MLSIALLSEPIYVMDVAFGPPAWPESIFFPDKEGASFDSKVSGIVSLNVVPASEVRSMDMSPPWSWMIFCATANPIPEPFSFP